MSKFGQSHRQLIKDTNEGNIEPQDVAHVSTSAVSGGRSVTRAQTETRGTQKALAKLAVTLGARVGEQHQQKEFAEGYASGTLEGYKNLRDNEGKLSQILFGKSSRLRGAQKRMLHDQTEHNYINNFKELDTDSKQLSTEAYHAKLNTQLTDTLETFKGDAEIQQQLVSSFAANAKQLARNHTTKRQIWVDAEQKRSVTDNIVVAGEVLKELEINGADVQSVEDAQKRLTKTFAKPAGMHKVPWSASTADAMITQLQRGDSTVMGFAESKNLLAHLRPEDRARVNAASEIWKRDNDKRLFEDLSELEQMSANGVDGREQIARQMSVEYPTFNLNAWREADRALEASRLEDARLKQERQGWLMTNDSRAQELTLEQKHEAFSGSIDDLTAAGIYSERLAAQRGAQYEGEELNYDIDSPITDVEKVEWKLRNPAKLTPMWQASQQTLPQLEQSISTMNQLVASPEIDHAGLATWGEHMDFANVFREADEALFNKHFKSDSELDRYYAMDFLVNQSGIPVLSAITTLRAIKSDKDFDSELPVPEELISSGVKSALNGFLNEKGERSMWFFNKDIDNEELFDSIASDHYERAYKTYKGNHSMAVHATRASMLRNGAIISNQFVPGGAVLDENSYGGSANTFVNAWLEDIRFQELLSMSGFPDEGGFPQGATMRASPNEQEIHITGTSNVNGMPIFLTLPLPKSQDEFPKPKFREKAKQEEFAKSLTTHPGL